MFASMLLLMAAAADKPAPLAVRGQEGLALEWTEVVSSPLNDWINDLLPLANGNLLAVGFVNRQGQLDPESDWAAVAVELRPDGRKVLDRRYGEGGGIDAFWSMLEGRGGRRMLAGFTTRIGNGGIDALSVLTNADGSVVVEKAYGGGGYDRFTDITQAGDGFVFAGHSQLPHQDRRRVFLVRVDSEGRPLWERMFDGAESWGALYLEPSGDGGFLIAGGVSAPGADRDMFVLKTDGEGRELWRKRVGTPDWDEINHGLVVRPNGAIVLVGYTNRRGTTANDLVAASLARDGTIQRLERWGGAEDDRAILAKLAEDGRIWVVGHTASAGAGSADLLLTSLDENGSFEGGAVTVGGPADDRGTAVLPLADGSLAIAGYSRSLGPNEEDAFIAKLRAPAGGPHPVFKREVVKAP